jgi:hypothetical protein
MIHAYFSSAWMILLECQESPAVQGPPIIFGWTMMVSTTPAWGMEPITSSLGAISPYHQAKARGAKCSNTYEYSLNMLVFNENAQTVHMLFFI